MPPAQNTKDQQQQQQQQQQLQQPPQQQQVQQPLQQPQQQPHQPQQQAQQPPPQQQAQVHVIPNGPQPLIGAIPAAPVQTFNLQANVSLPKFDGTTDGRHWWSLWSRYANGMAWTIQQKLTWFPLFLLAAASTWYAGLPQPNKDDGTALEATFKKRFTLQHIDLGLLSEQQGDETCTVYLEKMRLHFTGHDLPETFLLPLLIRGLRPELKAHVMPSNPRTYEELLRVAKLAERTVKELQQCSIRTIQTQPHISSVETKLAALTEAVLTLQRNAHPPQPPQANYQRQDNQGPSHRPPQPDRPNYPAQDSRNSRPITKQPMNNSFRQDNNGRFHNRPNNGGSLPDYKLDQPCRGFFCDETSTLILGRPFLTDNKAHIDYDTSTLTLQNEIQVDLIQVPTGLTRVAKTVKLPPRSQTTIPVHVDQIYQNQHILIEPCANIDNNGVLVARCVSKIHNGRSMVTILNPNDHPVRIRSNKVIAIASDICEDSIQSLDETPPTVNTVRTPEDESEYEDFMPNLPMPQDYKTGESDLNFDLSQADLTESQKVELRDFLKEWRNVFATDLSEIGRTHIHEYKIETEPGAKPVRMPFYRTGPLEKAEIEKQVADMLKHDIIEASTSEWHSPVILCKKKNSTEFRFAIDYRRLNSITSPLSTSLPRQDDIADMIGTTKAQVFSSLDLFHSYWQVPLHPSSRHKASFITHQGIFTPKVLSFGLRNSPAIFQLVVSEALRSMAWIVMR
ncbi:uncharacterized protein LOC135491573 [Lineus longissimus]|uniref:uncharacterized protein LOC135491573 n=1 Tax=Lineus longissimus TaxID=88925 RepID=UPI00315DB663